MADDPESLASQGWPRALVISSFSDLAVIKGRGIPLLSTVPARQALSKVS